MTTLYMNPLGKHLVKRLIDIHKMYHNVHLIERLLYSEFPLVSIHTGHKYIHSLPILGGLSSSFSSRILISSLPSLFFEVPN